MDILTGIAVCRAVDKLVGFGFVFIFTMSMVYAQCTPVEREKMAKWTDAKIIRIGTAEVRTASTFVADYAPCLQPEVYWHDMDWHIDLLLPSAPNDAYSLSIRPKSGAVEILKLPNLYTQFGSIALAPNNKAIVVAYAYGSWSGEIRSYLIVDLILGKVIDEITASRFSVSPNRRFILFRNWSGPPEDQETSEKRYRLYDTMKSPRENVCGYMSNDPKHERLDEEMRGFQVYPRMPGQVSCNDPEKEEEEDYEGSDFAWSADSSKVAFIDVKNTKRMSLILVTMPTGPKDHPQTSVYGLDETETHCAEIQDWDTLHDCSLEWESKSDNAVSILSGDQKNRTFPISKFVPIGDKPKSR